VVMLPPAPRLLVQLEPQWEVFVANLKDFLRPPQLPPLRISSRPGTFWPDVFVTSGPPWRRLMESAGYHIVVIAAILGISAIWPTRPEIVQRPAFDHSDVVYFSAAEYLPKVDTGGRQKHSQKGQPAFAKQPIISVPRESDNRMQTIVAPPNLKLDHDVPMPNIVSWPDKRLTVPLAATARSTAEMKTPTLPNSVVAPAPDLKSTTSTRSMRGPQAAIVEPPPTMDNSIRRVGDINIGHAEVVAPAPQLPVSEQRAANSSQPSLGAAGGAGAVVPPPPSVQGTGTGSSGGRLIALGINPVEAHGPVEAPGGNRSGTFSATPGGKPGAPGTPDIVGGDSNAAGAGSGHSGEGAGSGSKSNGIPSGIFVGAGPDSASKGAMAGATRGNSGSASNDARLTADAIPPRVGAVSHSSASEVSGSKVTDVDKKVFGDHRFYSMSLNMPNLNSAGGSWVIRFAELKQTDEKGALIGPEVTRKVDPAYPTEVMRHNVQGTVTLYAVIHSDGSVDGVRVLNGLDDQLDEYACAALAHWRFRPATKNGNAVDLMAVVVIPFKPVKLKSAF
jgi:TonB family protein